jgi:carbazole 1,9a-dioxygenase terminal dioxygenase component
MSTSNTSSFVDERYAENLKAWGEYYRAKLGFRNYWYAACLSNEIADGDWLARKILGEDILFRRIGGKVYAMHDRCIHRGVKLSDRVECHTDSTITCWWHGFTYRWTDGTVTDIVGAPDSKLVGRARIKVYPVQEAQGMVFVFIGDPGVEVPPLSDHVPPTFLDEDRVVEGESCVVNSNWRLGPEGGLDEIHRYLHRTSTLLLETKATMPLGHRGARTQCEIVDNPTGPKGIIDRFATDTMYFEVPIDGVPAAVTGVRFAETGIKRKRTVATSSWLPGVLRVEGFPEDGGCFYEFYVPINETQHRCFMMITQTCRTPQEEAEFRSRYRMRWRRHAIHNFLRQDISARESAAAFYHRDRSWLEEVLTEEDYMIIEWRKLCSRHSKGVQTPEHVDRPRA